MQIILKNATGTNINFPDLGLTIYANSQTEIDFSEVDSLGASSDMESYITAESIVVNDGTQDLSAVDAINYLRSSTDLSNYYTIIETDGLLDTKAPINHEHNALYYPRADVDAMISSSGSYGIRGAVDTYADLLDVDTSGMNIGDIYIVRGTTGDSPQAWLDGWNYRLQIQIQQDHIYGDLTDFPVFLDLTQIPSDHNFWTHVKSDGGDLRITDSNNNLLPFEIVSFNNTPSENGLDLYEYHEVEDHPEDHDDFLDIMEESHDEHQIWTNNIDGSGQAPISGRSDEFALKFEGYIYAPTTGVYTFATDSDDASEIEIDGVIVVGWYGAHGESGDWSHSGDVTLTQGYHRFIYRHEEGNGDAAWKAGWKKPEDSSIDFINQSYFYRSNTTVGEIWFKTSLVPDQDNTFYVYYGNSSADLLTNTDTYGRNNVWTKYEAVYHFEEVEDASNYDMIDSTGSHDGTHDNTDPISNNIIGKSIEYDGDDYSYTDGLDTDSSWTGLTMSMWVNKSTSNTSGDQRFVTKSSSNDLHDHTFCLMHREDGSKWNAIARISTNTTNASDFNFNFDAGRGNWYLHHLTWDGSTLKGFINSQLKNSTSLSGNHIRTDSTRVMFGDSIDYDRGFTGLLDEVRISKESLSSQWIQTEYYNQIFSSLFYTIGGEEEFSTTGGESQSIPGTYTPNAHTFFYMKFDGDNLNQIGAYQPSMHSVIEYDTGLTDQCAVFDNDDYLDFGSNAFFAEGNEITIGMWVYFDTFQTYDTLVQRYESGPDEGFRFGLHNGKLELEIGNGSQFLRLTSTNEIPKYEWVHIGFTYDGNNGITSIYQNAAIMNSSTSMSGPLNTSNKNLYINWDSSYGYGAQCKIEEAFGTNELLTTQDFETIVYGSPIDDFYSEGFWKWSGSEWVFLARNSTAVMHNDLLGLDQGDFQHLSNSQKQDLTDGGETILHVHDSRYYTESETTTLLDGKADISHTHSNYYTQTQVDSLINSIDYATISGNDSNTNIIANELEALTNGSNADGLHTHNIEGGDFDLDDVYENGSTINIDGSALELNASNGNAPLQLNTLSYIPNANLAGGQLCVYDNELFLYDSIRSKWLSVSGHYIGGGYNSNNIKDSYLKGYNGTSFTDDVGWVAPWDGTIIAIAISSNDDNNNDVVIKANGSNISGAILSYNNNKKNWSNTIDANFNEGDVLNFYVDGWDNGCDRPQCWAIIKRRI